MGTGGSRLGVEAWTNSECLDCGGIQVVVNPDCRGLQIVGDHPDCEGFQIVGPIHYPDCGDPDSRLWALIIQIVVGSRLLGDSDCGERQIVGDTD